MSALSTDFDRAALGRVYEQTIAGEYLRFTRHWVAIGGTGHVSERLGGTEQTPAVTTAGPPGSVISFSVGFGLDGPIEPAVIDRAEELHRSMGGDPVFEVSPYADPSYPAELKRRGYVLRELLHTFYLPMVEPPDLPMPEGVRVERVDKSDPAMLGRAIRANASGREHVSGSADDPPSELALGIAGCVISCPENATFAAYLDDEDRIAGVATCGLWDHPLAAGHMNLYQGSTMPFARRRGVQLALMLARLRWGFGEGSRSASLDCLPGVASERNAARAGFGLLYTKPVLTAGFDGS
ncbi:MAG: hypothetical protein AAFR38_03360 [Planctomycetota bacterium]